MTKPIPPTEADKKLRKAGRAYRTSAKIASQICPELINEVGQIISTSIICQRILPDETLRDIVDRLCPHVHDVVAANGLRLDIDLPENTHENLCLGKIFYLFKPGIRH